MLTATEIKAEFATLTGAEKAARLIEAGYVRSNGKADFVKFYETLLSEKSDREPISERADLMLHFVNKWAQDYSIRDLKLNWQEYAKQVEIDNGYDDIDEFIEQYGLSEIDCYDCYADMVNDYPQDAVEAFIKDYGMSFIQNFPEAYQGTYRSEAEFAEEFCTQQNEIPFYIVADWQATWDYSLRHDYVYDEDSGAVFAQNF